MANPANITINECSANGSITQPAVQTIDTNGTITMLAGGKTDRIIIEAVNAAAQILTLTVQAGTKPPSLQSRDLAVAIPATTGKAIIGPFESSRFAKANGNIDINFTAASGSPNLAVRVYRLPKA